MSTQRSWRAAIDQVHESSIAAAGLDDFGDQDYRHALGIFLDAHEQCGTIEGERHPVMMQTVEILLGRLHTSAGPKARARSLAHNIQAPLFILGLPRTRAVALHHLLMRNAQSQRAGVLVDAPTDGAARSADLAVLP